MKVTAKTTLSIFVAAALAAVPATAEGDGPLLILDEAIELALEQNHLLGAAEAAVGEAEAGLLEARSGHLPRVGFDANFSRTTNPTLVFSNKLGQESLAAEDLDLDRLNEPDPLSNFQGVLAIHQPIYRGGATRSGIDAAAAERGAAVSERERTRQEVVRQVIAAYTHAVLARDRLDVAQESLRAARANVELETEVQELVARAESAVEIARATLNLTLGRDLDTSFSLPPGLEIGKPADETLDALIDGAVEQRPDLEAAREHLRAAEQGVRAARSGHLPDVGATGLAEANSEQLFGSYGTNWTVFVGARFKLFDGKQTRARVRRASERTNRARRELLLLEQSVDLEVRQAFYDRRAAGKRLEQTAAAVEMAHESLRIVRDRYGEGLTTLVELLDSETRLTTARNRDVAARRDALLAQARLDLASGRL
jgi:outer membrane protein TolC